jgi:DDE family transposase
MEKKQPIGEYYQEGRGYCTESRKVNDHDFAEEIVNSYGIYDIKRNEGYMTLGTSKETSEFACDCIKGWWERYGKIQYPKASSILITADGGGSNSSRHYIFKEDLQKLANEIGITIRMAHYPPYTSKYNPIEHRLFCHVTRACSKTVLTSVELLKELIQKTSTSTGLKVFASIIDKIYKTARKASTDFRKHMPIVADTYLGQWNYRAVPQAV